ncbi:MAG: deoxyribose-phosphate aldolase [Armatimonadota bacterium]|nr:deoxyribose-phosphate aldolase [Armatimonadota bacterium]MCX7776597.1 deoxyribose-phosphate aldolase [Armatimonadota bacterium]MDW8025260.1 deoxyribose-phosphate aldolase [Armatimonadota bacterium]
MSLTKRLAEAIDLSMLHPTLRETDIERGCRDAVYWGVASVCVLPCWVRFASELVNDSSVAVGTVVGFPLGGNETSVKAFEARRAIQDGATEIDMVMNIGFMKSGRFESLLDDMKAVVDAAQEVCESLRGKRAIVKIILETGYLEKDEIVRACELALASGADFVKTSTGFGPKGATVEDVKLMRSAVGDRMKIKAAGGIRALQQAIELLDAGADRLGTSHGVAILLEAQRESS